MPSTSGEPPSALRWCALWSIVTRIESTDGVAGSLPNKNVLFFNNRLINVHPLKTTMYTFIQNDDNNQYDKKKKKPRCVRKLLFQATLFRRSFEWKMPHTEQLTIDV
jgi:hypothetical protein